jgi:hypothetical protein
MVVNRAAGRNTTDYGEVTLFPDLDTNISEVVNEQLMQHDPRCCHAIS